MREPSLLGPLSILAGRDRKDQGEAVVAALMSEPRKPTPVVRLVEDDYDGAYDDMPSRFAAAA